MCGCLPRYFYPRSPCGERLANLRGLYSEAIFLSTLSLRRATAGREFNVAVLKFLSTLSLRRATLEVLYADGPTIFLSTLSLRRATTAQQDRQGHRRNFYPRSPCGERQARPPVGSLVLFISIHALLAESDIAQLASLKLFGYFYPRSPCGERLTLRILFAKILVFLSTLSLRRATWLFTRIA